MEEDNQKVGEEEKPIGEADNSAEQNRVEFVEAVDPANSIGGGSNLQIHNSKVLDAAISEMKQEDENIVKFSKHTGSVMPEVTEENRFPSSTESEGLIHFLGDNVAAPEETTEDHPMSDDNVSYVTYMIYKGIPEGDTSSSASKEDTRDSSIDSDLDSSCTVDGYLPVSAHVAEPSDQHDQIPEPKNEKQMPQPHPRQRMARPTSWKNCCGLLEFLRSSN